MKPTRFDFMMIGVAARRGVVMLDDGRTARLTAWKPHKATGGRRPVFRVLFPSGRQASVRIRRLAGILSDDGTLVPITAQEAAAHEHRQPGCADVHVGGSGRVGRSELPTGGPLVAHGTHPGGVEGQPGVRVPPVVHRPGSAGAGGRGVDAAPGDGLAARLLDRSAVGSDHRKGTQ